ncbi:peptidase M23B [Calothrix parasitica NIES-267]|uniref:Peptidase M23B n=1 Tax=Calothrix parasitica NIES-267 TaxID=1973488 RepID=A0A1Z4LW46_9CYAN|nr:peptidase M23B [Calothrix parasitica NIES-267]
MTQRKNSANNNSQSAWQRSLPAQSLCWLGSFSLLSSGFVVAQTSPGIDNIVPTVKSSQASSTNKLSQGKAVIISGAPRAESSRPKVEFSQRRNRLRQRLSVKKSPASSAAKKPKVKVTTNKKKGNNLRTRLKRSRTNSVVVKLKKKRTPANNPRVVIKKKNPNLKPSAPKIRIASPKKPQTILPRTTTVRKPQKDYNNALIDPTNYGKKYQAPSSVLVTGRKTGCTSVANGQGFSGNCATSGQRVTSSKTNPAKKTTPSWLRASQNASVAKTPSRSVAAQTKKIAPSQAVSSREVTKTVLPSARANTYRATKTIKRVASVTPNIVKKAAKSATPTIRPKTASRAASPSLPKQAFNPNRFIPQPSSFTPQATFSEQPITPSGGMLPAPVMANNFAPRPSAVAYDIPLASALPKVAYSGPAYNPTGLIFPLSVPSAISSVFGWRQHPISGNQRFHTGIDIAAASGTPVVAAYSGKVEISDWVSGYGITVILNHNSAQQTLYGHMSETFVRPGQWVERGTVIGSVGSTGNSTGPHLHFETRQLTPNGWVATNPGAQLQVALNQLLESIQTARVVKSE